MHILDIFIFNGGYGKEYSTNVITGLVFVEYCDGFDFVMENGYVIETIVDEYETTCRKFALTPKGEEYIKLYML